MIVMSSLHSLSFGDHSFQGMTGWNGSLCLVFLPNLQNVAFGSSCFANFSTVFIRSGIRGLFFSCRSLLCSFSDYSVSFCAFFEVFFDPV